MTTKSAEVEEQKEEEKEEEEVKDCLSVKEAAEAASLTNLLVALVTADLVDAVNDPEAQLTIFAPTDKAFMDALASLGLTFEQLAENTELLAEILKYHVLPSPQTSMSLAEKGTLPTLLGDDSPCGQPNLSFTSVG